MRKLLGAALTAMAAVVALTSCSQSTTGQGPGPSVTTSAPPPVATQPLPGHSFVVTRDLDARAIAAAVDPKTWNRDLVLDTTRNSKLPKEAVVHDLTDSGGLLISQSEQVIKDGEPILQPAKTSLWSADGRQRLLDDAAGRAKPVRQPINGRAHGPNATWVDTTSVDLFKQDWQIRYFDAAARTTRLIADSAVLFPGVKNLRPPPGDTTPIMAADGTIYWEAAVPDAEAHLGYTGVIMARDSRAKGPVRTVVRKASTPAVVGNTLYYSHLDDVSPETPQKKLEIHARTPDGTDRVVVEAPLIKDQQILQLAATSTHLAWVISDTDRQAPPGDDLEEGCRDTKDHGCSLYLMKHGSNQALRIKLHTYTAVPVLTPTLLGWGGSSSSGDTGEYVMDLATSKVWRVGSARGCSEVVLAGAYASWSTGNADGQCNGQVVVRWRTPS
ncbi:hypothetical protein [Kribbella lupini]|uniref:Uncharacterized protein n=1 Tax=Kribbella lupini TaxID=291602 RepID=A0ABP4MEQ2_9ACTN